MKTPMYNFHTTVLTQLPIHEDFMSLFRKKECMLIFKEKTANNLTSHTEEVISRKPIVDSNSKFSQEEVKSDADLIGTPLECPFDLEVLKIQDDDFYSKECMESHHKSELKTCPYKPFSSYEARGILYTFILDPSFHSTMPVFCFCNAEDGEKTSILGFEKGTKNKELIHYKITVNGPLKVTHPSVQFDAVKSEMRFLAENGEFTVRAFAAYEAYRGINLIPDNNGDEAFVRLECSWKNPTKILDLPHIASQAKVIVRPFPGETCSGAYEIWRQLNTLQHLITGIKSLEITWFVKASQKTLREEIDKLIAVFSKDDSYYLKEKLEFEELYDEQLIYKRTPMDFVDHLWELLSQNCSSFSDLSQSLQYTLQRAKADHPMVFFDNPTRFAKLLRQNDAPPQFTGMEPVELLIEMGVEKLKRDYLYIFSGNNLVAERVISSFLPQEGMPFHEQLHCLTAIQSALEVVCLCQRVLQLPQLALRDVATPLLEHYRNAEVPGSEFSFQVGVCLLKNFFQHQENGAAVDKWRVEFTSTSDSQPVRLVCQLTASPATLDASTAGEETTGERYFSVERYLSKTHRPAN